MKKLALGIALLVSTCCVLWADSVPHSEYEIKAAFLYNFAKFVEWPPETFQQDPSRLVIGILGSDPFGKALDDALAGKTIQDKQIVLKRVSSLDQVSGCQVLFISASKESEAVDILYSIKGRPILTVSDMDRFVQQGGVVGFTVEEKKVRFSVNVKSAEQAGLKVSSQLLKLAKRVISRRLEQNSYVCLPSANIQYARN